MVIQSASSVSLSTSVEENLCKEVLTSECLRFLVVLHDRFESERQEILESRKEFQIRVDKGLQLDFLASTEHVRESNWTVSPLPKAMQQRWAEITSPVSCRKMVINALNSGADCYVADFEDSCSPTWQNILAGHVNLRDAVRRCISFSASGKEYKLNEKTATLLMRPRGWHMNEKHIKINGQHISASLFDFGVYFYHNAKILVQTQGGPYFYLPKLEGHLEARLWNDVFKFCQKKMGIPNGTIKATVSIETLPAAFEMDEILYELREHSSGLSAGRWDYIFSCIKTFRYHQKFVFPDRELITKELPFMRARSTLLLKTCHRRNAPAMGGMSALIPITGNAVANEKALRGIRDDKAKLLRDGFDGSWVAHPGLVEPTRHEFAQFLVNKPNQISKKFDDAKIPSSSLLPFQSSPPCITEEGIRWNVSICLQYITSFLNGAGCIRVKNLMEDAATAEISRSLLWQWVHSPFAVLDDGRSITMDFVDKILLEENHGLQKTNSSTLLYHTAEDLLKNSIMKKEFDDFLVSRLYKVL